MKRRGFTLSHFLMAASLVMVAAAILFPVFQRARECCGGSSCQQNIRQVGLAIKQYLSDYDETFPIVKVGTNPYGWADALQPYARNTQLFQCPGDSKQPPTAPATTVVGSDPAYTDYFFNSRLENQRESKLRYIANIVMLGDATPGDARQHSIGGTSLQAGLATLTNRAGVPIGAATRHEGGANYVFADGHVKWLKGSGADTCPAIKNAASDASSTNPGFAVR